MIKIISHAVCKSVKRLGFDVFYPYMNGYRSIKEGEDIFIRWGYSGFIQGKDQKRDFRKVLNGGESIKTNLNKQLALKKMSKVVKVPNLFIGEIPRGEVGIIRPMEHNFGGKDFFVQQGQFFIGNYEYAVHFIRTDLEYRVWFCGEKTMMAKRTTTKPLDKYPCRSKWGYEFLEKVPDELHKQTLAAAKEMNLDFGAADVLFYKNDYVFLELNSMPSCDAKEVTKFLKESLAELVNKKFGV